MKCLHSIGDQPPFDDISSHIVGPSLNPHKRQGIVYAICPLYRIPCDKTVQNS
eukprot:NODE_3404_length_559_cov_24.507843_g2872_i0.p1 GENE.NODE_3404_length_559_cov_24.507843_g2872_i0~~NODE_3404_length_559_cov_24.507843_g2872_i0.p1  ORF type:complete len:60 (-),score=6.16 NODE_3404_length_559_cov_24.507843_g2872_i0:380-538(-)